MFFTRISEIKRKKSESYIGFDKSTSTLEERLQARLRRLSPYPFGSVEKGLERETLLPFPRVRRFGTHCETGSKFLLLFSIKSKEEHPCFAEKVPNGRTTNLVQEIFCANALYICRFRLVGKGLERETLLPFPRLRRFGTHCETGSKFLLLFSIKSKEEILCFAKIVPNWRNTHVAQAKLLRNCAQPVRSTAILCATAPNRRLRR